MFSKNTAEHVLSKEMCSVKCVTNSAISSNVTNDQCSNTFIPYIKISRACASFLMTMLLSCLYEMKEEYNEIKKCKQENLHDFVHRKKKSSKVRQYSYECLKGESSYSGCRF